MATTSVGGAPLVVARYRRIPVSPRCFCDTVKSFLLRSQLDRLHAEAESTRAKASSNRLRLLRLSEAAENLRKQAAVNVQTGKENDARELLPSEEKGYASFGQGKSSY